jgi:putative ABC transport system permease protein
MLLRILSGTFARQKRRKAVAFLAVTLGTAAASALFNMALGVGDQVNRELRSFGANLVVVPAGEAQPVRMAGQDLTGLRPRAYLAERDLPKAKDNFWVHNILALSPLLDGSATLDGRTVPLLGTWFQQPLTLTDGTPVPTGVRDVYPFWSVEGSWPEEDPARQGDTDQALVGRSLARALDVVPGHVLRLTVDGRHASFVVTGILDAGGDEDRAIVTTLDAAQELFALPDRISRILVSALTTPEDRAVARLGMDPADLSPQEFEEWSCTPFVSSIAYELEQSVPGSRANVIRRVAESEGEVLGRIGGLLALIAVMAGLAAALTVTSALTTGVLERRGEIGLLKSLGATNARVVGFFLAEAAVLGLAGGVAGGLAGAWLARDLARLVFGSPLQLSPFALPLAVAAAVGITLAGCALPARRIVSLRPVQVLHGL